MIAIKGSQDILKFDLKPAPSLTTIKTGIKGKYLYSCKYVDFSCSPENQLSGTDAATLDKSLKIK